MRKIILAGLAVFCLTNVSAQAQEQEQNQDQTTEAIENLSLSVHQNLDKARLPDGTIIGERANDLEYPLLPYEVRELLITAGSVSGMGEACDMNWQTKNFEPLMISLRDNNAYSDYEMAYAAMLHGAAMGGGVNVIEKQYECTDEVKEKIRTNFIVAE